MNAPDRNRRITIHAATDADLQALAALFDAYRVFYGRAADLAAAKSFVRDRSATRFFIAKLDSAPIGFVHLLPSFDTLDMRPMWILEDLFVAPAYRRLGAGAALLRHAEAFATSTGAARLSLTTAHTNVAAQRLYVANGYVLDEVFRTYHRRLT